jgi:hypothetical protein
MILSAYRFSVKRDIQEEMACFEELKCLDRLLVIIYIRLERITYISYEDLSLIYRLRQFHFSFGLMGKFLPTRHEKRVVSIRCLDLCSKELIRPLLSHASSLYLDNCLGLSEMLEDLVINSVGCFTGLKTPAIDGCRSSIYV